ncbi:phage tail protein I [Epibacterium ulvae]|uniref:phage tail protein I n=1 Tax=Epibacterium ulvae TaxID=1156985 RepID=UPI002493775D|nr:phage tail protein I [Epibacterium ulvae]
MFDLATIQRPNRTLFEVAMEQSIQESAPDLSPVAQLMDPETCPPHLLGWLAWALSVDVWDAAWDEATKRRVLAHSLEVHRRKGTVGAIQRVVASVFGAAQLVEAGEDDSLAPFEFALSILPETQFRPESFATLVQAVDAAKPVRSQLAAIRLQHNLEHRLRVGQIVRRAKRTRIALKFGAFKPQIQIRTASVFRVVRRTVIAPAALNVSIAPSIVRVAHVRHRVRKTVIKPRLI